MILCSCSREKAAIWWVKKGRMQQVDELCENLKIASGWPAMGLLFGNCKTMKIAEALAIAGDRGVYLLRMCGLPPRLHDAIITVVQCAGDAYIIYYVLDVI
jgi:hypothetical protein